VGTGGIKMKVLVTGGAGFIGSFIVDELVENGYEVVVLDSLEKQVHNGVKPNYLNSKAELLVGSVGDKKILKKALEGVEAIIHQAALVGVGQSMYEISRYVDGNTGNTVKMLQYLVDEEHDVKKLIVASSMSIYGEGKYNCSKCGIIFPKFREKSQLESHSWEMKCPKCGGLAGPLPTDEEKPLFSTSVYALSKKDQEEYSMCVGNAYGIPTVALRYFNVYGPRQALSNPYTGVCSIFSSRIKNNNPPIIYEDGKQKRDFIHVKDVARANVMVLENRNADYEIFNVGTGRGVSILEVANVLIKKYNSKVKPLLANKYREGDIRYCFADVSKIKRKVGFEASIKFEDGIDDLIQWVDKQQDIKDGFQKAEEELKKRKLIK
jgi:dTDP-L-rhamnose 4-epimerase